MPAKKEKRQEFTRRYEKLSADERLKVMNNIRTFIGEPTNMRNVNEISSYIKNNKKLREIIDKASDESFDFFNDSGFTGDRETFLRRYVPEDKHRDVLATLQEATKSEASQASKASEAPSFHSIPSEQGSLHADPNAGIEEREQSGSPIIVANPTKVTAPAKMPKKKTIEIEDTPSPDRKPKPKSKASKFFGDENEPSDDDHPSPPARNPNKTPSATSDKSEAKQDDLHFTQETIDEIERQLGKEIDKATIEDRERAIKIFEQRSKDSDVDVTKIVDYLRNTQTKGLLLHSNTKKFHPDHLRPNPNGMKISKQPAPKISTYTDMTKPVKLGSVSQAREGLSKFARNMGKK